MQLIGKDSISTNLRGKGASRDTYKLSKECIESIKWTLEKEVEEKLEAIIAQMEDELKAKKEKKG